MRKILALALLMLLTTPGWSQTRLRKTGGSVSIDFHDVDIQDVAKSIGEITGKNFILDDRVRGKVTIISPSPVTVEEAYQAFLSALEVKNLTTVEVGKFTKIIPKREGKENPIPFASDKSGLYGDQLVTRLIALKFISSNEIRQALNALVSRTGSIVAYGPTNSLIITDSASNVARLERIIDKLDKQGFQSSVEVIPLKFAQADDVSEKLLSIFESQKKTASRRRSDDVEGGEAISKILPDMRTNSLIVSATREGLGRVLDLVAELDKKIEVALDRGRIHVKYLKHADAEELGELMSNLLGTSGGGKKKKDSKQSSAQKRGFNQAAPMPWEKSGEDGFGADSDGGASHDSSTGSGSIKVSGGGRMFENEVRVVADNATNSLLVTASPTDWETILPVIEQLDVRRPQVFVEALILEVNLTRGLDVGLSGHGGAAAGGFNLFGQSALGLSPLAAVGANGADAAKGLGTLGGLTLGGLSQQQMSLGGIKIPVQGALFRAVQTSGALNVLSAPNILTTDNKKAEILVGNEVAVKTNEYAGTDGKPVTNFSRQKVGIQLAVTPQINEGDEVTLEIEQKIQEILPKSDPLSEASGNISTSERTAKTTVVAQNGQTIVIGGLIKDKDSKTTAKVPLLGDIPVLGYLFRQTSVTKEKINLMIFLTPHVIHEPADMTRVSVKKNNERRRFNKVQGIGENRALYDYDLDSGLNMAPPKPSTRTDVKPKKKFNFDQLEEAEATKAPVKEDMADRRPSKRIQAVDTAYTSDDEVETPRSRRDARPKSSTASGGNPFADIRPPSSN